MVPWHEEDEVYIFSSSGKHLETRSLFSDSLLVGFAYDTQGNLERVYNKNQESLRIEQKIQGDFVYLNEVHVATLMIGTLGIFSSFLFEKKEAWKISLFTSISTCLYLCNKLFFSFSLKTQVGS